MLVLGVSVCGLCSCGERFQLFFFSCSPWGSAVVSAPVLSVGHPQKSTPGAHESTPARRGHGEGGSWGHKRARPSRDGAQRKRQLPPGLQEHPPWWESFLVPGGAGADASEERLQWCPCRLHITQRQCFACMAVWVSSTSIPGCRFP